LASESQVIGTTAIAEHWLAVVVHDRCFYLMDEF
jgi:hypothetical protein